MKSLVNTQKQQQFKKFMAKDSSFLKKIVGGDDKDKVTYPQDKIKF
ncbi:MAG: hypothetical protein N4A71_18810 [Carboxylicivirga sp.]|jgi:hypothetical protein|nr:hypothetical protein [Carboxylicivirga sp.]